MDRVKTVAKFITENYNFACHLLYLNVNKTSDSKCKHSIAVYVTDKWMLRNIVCIIKLNTHDMPHNASVVFTIRMMYARMKKHKDSVLFS